MRFVIQSLPSNAVNEIIHHFKEFEPLGGDWFWERLGNWHCFELNIDMDGSIDNSPEKPNEI